jgi:plasmid stabilization system protein ParE
LFPSQLGRLTADLVDHLLLVRFDQLGRKTRRVGVRELHIENTPYVVVSRRLDDEILILRIFSNGSAIQAR